MLQLWLYINPARRKWLFVVCRSLKMLGCGLWQCQNILFLEIPKSYKQVGRLTDWMILCRPSGCTLYLVPSVKTSTSGLGLEMQNWCRIDLEHALAPSHEDGWNVCGMWPTDSSKRDLQEQMPYMVVTHILLIHAPQVCAMPKFRSAGSLHSRTWEIHVTSLIPKSPAFLSAQTVEVFVHIADYRSFFHAPRTLPWNVPHAEGRLTAPAVLGGVQTPTYWGLSQEQPSESARIFRFVCRFSV